MLIEPTVPILLLASVAHIVRHNITDLVVFAGTAAVIVLDSFRPAASVPPSRSRSPRRRRPLAGWRPAGPWFSVLAVVAFAILAAIPARDSMTIRTVLVLGALAALYLVVVHPAPPVPRAQPSPRGWWVWAVIGVAACVWELTSFIFQQTDPTRDTAHPISDTTHPAVSDLIGPWLTDWAGRTVFLFLWAAAGVWLLRRFAVGGRPESGEDPDARTVPGRTHHDAHHPHRAEP